MTFSELKPYDSAYKKEMELRYNEMEYNAWLVGAYTRIAISTSTVGNSSFFTKKANIYPKQPYGSKEKIEENLSEEESEELAVFKMKTLISEWENTGLPQAPS